jgi:uncharacterized protein YdiU (UPF0061 family)
VLREYLVSEAMAALGIPTTRALAAVATGEPVTRERILPGAVLTRIASSHVRVGTFQFFAAREDTEALRLLADHVIVRHYPSAAEAERPYHALLDAVIAAQADLVARWLLVGFIHGVMNTDNMSVAGETIDYGPCAFMDAYSPATVFSSIDYAGRYAYGNQPRIAHWNLARLAEAMLPLFADDVEAAVAAGNTVLQTFEERYQRHFLEGMRRKLGLVTARPGDDELARELLELLERHRADMTSTFRALSDVLRGDVAVVSAPLDDPAFAAWVARWRTRVAAEGRAVGEVAAAMDRINPIYIPRNHLVEAALTAATAGDTGPYEELLEVVTHPFDARSEWDRYSLPAPLDGGCYRTFCGT